MLQASVGRGGSNRPEDVRLVQSWLNRWRFLDGRRPLRVDGQCSPAICAAIRQFEIQALGKRYPSDRLHPASESVRILQTLPAWSDAEAEPAS